MKTNNIVILSIKELLDENDSYVIPIYQRNYAWGEGHITQLIQDVIDSIHNNPEETKTYYIGTLIVYVRQEKNSTVFETIDGQQRLTTLSLLATAIRNKYQDEFDMSWFKDLNLNFDSRETSSMTLDAVFQDTFPVHQEYNQNVKNGYELAITILEKKLFENKIGIKEFAEYLFNHVQIFRVPVPEDTDLNGLVA